VTVEDRHGNDVATRRATEASGADQAVELRLTQQAFEEWKSPFVPSHELQRLDDVVDNGAERAFSYAEREQRHRHDMDERQAKRLERADKREYTLAWAGMIFAFALAVIAIGTGAYLGVRNHPWAGSILSALGVSLIIAAFLKRPSKQD
jgi:uncharacterized membrane protein